MTNKLKFIVLAAVVVTIITATARAATVEDVITSIWQDKVTPIIFEDDGGSLLIMSGPGGFAVGDKVVGVVNLPQMKLGGSDILTDSIRDISGNVPAALMGYGTGNNGLTILMMSEIGSIDLVNGIMTMTNVADATQNYSFTDPDDASNTITISGFGNSTSVAQIFDDPSPEQFDWLDTSAIFDNTGSLSGDTLMGEVGMTGVVDEFYDVYFDASGVTGFEMNLDLTVDNFKRSVLKNRLGVVGCDMYAEGDYTGTTGHFDMHDGDFKVLFAPVPAAVYPGLVMLGALGIWRRRSA